MSWITRLLGVDKMVNNKIDEKLKWVTIPDLTSDPSLQDYRAREYRVWASTNPNSIFNFYHRQNAPDTINARLPFWSWVGDLNVPKLHYPAAESLMEHIKSILFGGDVALYVHKDGASEKEIEEMNERVLALYDDINFEEFLHKASDMATYSGTIVPKITIDPSFHDKPIVEVYPRERIEIRTKYGKPIEYIFKDKYTVKDKDFTLHTIYGRGYIRYKLINEKGKEVPLTNVPELVDLEDFVYDGNFILTTHLKNRTASAEFPDSAYGGSDFEGLIDNFHMIDEIYSSLIMYIRRNRPIQAITEDLLPMSDDGKRTYVPKEYEFDTIKLRPQQDASGIDKKFYRDSPELKVQPFLDSINDLVKVNYHKVGLAYTSVGLEGVGANASGHALEVRETSTIVVRDNKIKLWKPFLNALTRILLMAEDLILHKMFKGDYADWVTQADFPEYNGQSYDEKVEELSKAKRAGLVSTALAVERLYSRDKLTEEQKAELVRDIKLEQGETILPGEIEGIE